DQRGANLGGRDRAHRGGRLRAPLGASAGIRTALWCSRSPAPLRISASRFGTGAIALTARRWARDRHRAGVSVVRPPVRLPTIECQAIFCMAAERPTERRSRRRGVELNALERADGR